MAPLALVLPSVRAMFCSEAEFWLKRMSELRICRGLVREGILSVALLILPVPSKFRADMFLVGPCARTSSVRFPSPDIPSTAETPAALAMLMISPRRALGARSDAVMKLLGAVYCERAKLTLTVVEPVAAANSLERIVSGVSARVMAFTFTGCGI